MGPIPPPARFHPDRDHGGGGDHRHPRCVDRATLDGSPRPGARGGGAAGYRCVDAGIEAVQAGQRTLPHCRAGAEGTGDTTAGRRCNAGDALSGPPAE
ncbi:hypothetical protein G6F32_016625 [Rhizopus arrhizus]|nr:hypothetical protein G6F32_016625 [Rhizopus arrhizus]